MQALKDMIRAEGRSLGNGILKVDGFINHRVHAQLMAGCGEALARHFEHTEPDLVLTAEISGIAPALMTAAELGCAIVYARKKKPITMPNQVYQASAPSHTKGHLTTLMVSPEFLHAGERVLIIDDFLASGQTIKALVELCRQAGAEVVGIGALVEKTFEHGRELLTSQVGKTPIHALAQITSLEDGKVVVAP
jgi:xanthine phosphoribosyltransferase